MECLSCNKPVENEWVFCPWCKTPLTDQQSEENFLEHSIEPTGLGVGKNTPLAEQSVGISNEHWVDIPAGEFIMGSPDGEAERGEDESRKHVKTDGFKMLITPVTFAMYDSFCDATAREKTKDHGWGRSNRPVINVTYWDAIDYCDFLSKKLSRTVRLPSEEEWEYACRAGTTTPFWTGSTISTEQANYDGNQAYGHGHKGLKRHQTTPVDMFQANQWGLYDMHGNVWEWCAFKDNVESAVIASDNDSDEPSHVLHGGSWNFRSGYLRSANRFLCSPYHASHNIGFRIVCE